MTTAPPDGTYQLDHVAIAVPRAAEVTPFLVGELGGRPIGAGPGIEFLWWQWAFARDGALEVLEPDGPAGGFVHRFLDTRGPGVHHVTFKVPDLAIAAAHVRSQGFDIVGYNDVLPSWKECFLHPKQAQGIVVQLAEVHPELMPEAASRLPYPPAPAPAPEAADFVGLRLSAISEERARLLWERTLGGVCDTAPGGLCFRWPASPLRVAVDVDPGAPEGPVAIELAAPLPRALPEGPHPVLGVPFVAVGGSGFP